MNKEQAWSEVKEQIKTILNAKTFKTIFNNSYIEKINGFEIIVVVQNRQAQTRIQNMLKQQIESILKDFSGGNDYKISEIKIENEANYLQEGTPTTLSTTGFKKTGLISKNSFDTYFIGEENQTLVSTTHAIADTIIRETNKIFNPFVIFGESGLGKTHLIQALGNKVYTGKPKLDILYVRSKEFIDDFVNAGRPEVTFPKNYEEFYQKYKTRDLLIIDDIQFFIGKDKTQEALFDLMEIYTFEERQLVFALDRNPRLLDIHERITSRLSSGYLSLMNPPGFETRLGILRSLVKIAAIGDIHNDVIEYIATTMNTNVRELTGAINKLLAMSTIQGVHKIDLQFAMDNLKEYVDDARHSLNIRKIKTVVADEYKINIKELDSKSRKKEVTIPRHIAIYLCCVLLDESVTKIGHDFGRRDHSTVLNSKKKIQTEIKTDPSLKFIVNKIEEKLTK